MLPGVGSGVSMLVPGLVILAGLLSRRSPAALVIESDFSRWISVMVLTAVETVDNRVDPAPGAETTRV